MSNKLTGKLVVLEGVDKTGKTTIAKLLQELFGFIIIKHSAPLKGEDVWQSYNATLDKLDLTTHSYVLDRFNWGELVYGPIYRGKSQLTANQCLKLEHRLNELGGVVVHCKANHKDLAKRFKTDGETFAKSKDIKLLLAAYEQRKLKSINCVFTHEIGKSELTDNKAFSHYLGLQ